jgi:hypothetical protein
MKASEEKERLPERIFWSVARASFQAGRPIPKNMLSVSCATNARDRISNLIHLEYYWLLVVVHIPK